jgi:hypothetical protein
MHHEHHVTSSETIRDIVIGMSDGLIVPFALAAGLSGAISSSGACGHYRHRGDRCGGFYSHGLQINNDLHLFALQ